jgi:hypothetical protein
MSRQLNDAELRDLVRNARVAGSNNPGTRRTSYLDEIELRQAPLPRLVTEVSRAEHPDASDRWRDERRGMLANELDRRHFPETAGMARESWDDARYAQAQAEVSRERAEDASRRAEESRREAENSTQQARQDGPQQPATGAVAPAAATAMLGAGVAGMAVASQEMEPEQADAQYLANEDALGEQWAGQMDDPSIGGEPGTATEATDLSVSVADSLSGSQAPAQSQEPAQTPTVDQEVQISPTT